MNVQRLSTSSPPSAEEQIKATVTGIQAVFVQQLLSVMRESIPENPLGGGFGEDVFTEQMDQRFSQVWVGSMEDSALSRALYNQLRAAAGISEPQLDTGSADTVRLS